MQPLDTLASYAVDIFRKCMKYYLAAIQPQVGPTILRDRKPRLPRKPRHPPKPGRAPVRLLALSWFDAVILKQDSLTPTGKRLLEPARCSDRAFGGAR